MAGMMHGIVAKKVISLYGNDARWLHGQPMPPPSRAGQQRPHAPFERATERRRRGSKKVL